MWFGSWRAAGHEGPTETDLLAADISGVPERTHLLVLGTSGTQLRVPSHNNATDHLPHSLVYLSWRSLVELCEVRANRKYPTFLFFSSFYVFPLGGRRIIYFRVDYYYYFSYSCFSPLSFCQL